MGTIKIEFDLPEFKNELQINIVIRKDGEVVSTITTPPSPTDNGVSCIGGELRTELVDKREIKSTSTASDKKNNSSSSEDKKPKKTGGNLMSLDL